jgi:hypothetical protein
MLIVRSFVNINLCIRVTKLKILASEKNTFAYSACIESIKLC